MSKVYNTLEEALHDIKFNKQSGLKASISWGYNPLCLNGLPYMDEFFGFVGDLMKMPKELKEVDAHPERYPHFEEKKQFLSVIWELTKNAYVHGSVMHKDKRFSLEMYTGDLGILAGTRQDDGFFTDEQIAKLKTGGYVKPTRGVDSSGIGLRDFILRISTGIFISKEEKEIFASIVY